MKDRLCTSCGYVGKPTTQGIGSFSVDAVIWLICLGLSVFSSIFAIMIIPVAWTIYHLALYRTTTCPQCGDIAMVNPHGKKAQAYREREPVKTVYDRQSSNEQKS